MENGLAFAQEILKKLPGLPIILFCGTGNAPEILKEIIRLWDSRLFASSFTR